MRKLPSAVLAVALTPALVALPTVTAPRPEARPVPPKVVSVPVSGVDAAALAQAAGPMTLARPDASAARPALLTAQDHVDPFDVVGVTWAPQPATGDVAVSVRVREDGAWTAWENLELTDEGPDADTAEGRAAYARAGTSPLLTDDADGVQVRIDTATGRAPADVRLELIDPGDSPADAHLDQAVPASSAYAAAPQPAIISRAQWGADESLRGGTSHNSTVKAVVIHHTASSNSYSSSTTASQLRGIYAYHTKSRGYSDIAYNFLVDKYGRIYEGRRGSITAAVRGAHAGGFNVDTMGVAALGNFDVTAAPTAMVDAIGRVTGWKLSQYGVNPNGSVTLTSAGGGTSKYAKGIRVKKPVVSGHIQFGHTACPGRYLDGKMSTIRSVAAATAGRPGTGGSTPGPAPTMARLAGADRFATSVAEGRAAFPSGKVVVLTSGQQDHLVDGLVAAPLAVAKKAPVLLVGRGVPAPVVAEIKRRGATTAWIVGGTGSVSAAIERQLASIGVTTVRRLAGENRYETAAAVARAVTSQSTAIVVASGSSLIDAMAAGGPAARTGRPILLVSPDGVPAATAKAARDLGATAAGVIGGSSVVPDAVADDLGIAWTRYGGKDRYETAVAVARGYGPRVGESSVVVASGADANLSDALAGGALGRLTVLVRPTSLPAATKAWLAGSSVTSVLVVGGTSAVSEATARAVSAAVAS